MPSPIVLKNPNSLQRRGLLHNHGRTSSIDGCITPRRNTTVKFGEVCGGTTADVAAVCCCCPCGLANLVVLAVYKVPAGLCRRALRHKRLRKLQKKAVLQPKNHNAHFSVDDSDLLCHDNYIKLQDVEDSEENQKAVLELENEMWQRFYGTGFWRSPSQNGGETPRFQVQPL